jgi:hypothetical protein
MMRKCSCCWKEFTPPELRREESKGMEADRKSLGLKGVLFRYYSCSACGHADIFVDVRPLEREPKEAFRRRRDELKAAMKHIPKGEVGLVLVERKQPNGTDLLGQGRGCTASQSSVR